MATPVVNTSDVRAGWGTTDDLTFSVHVQSGQGLIVIVGHYDHFLQVQSVSFGGVPLGGDSAFDPLIWWTTSPLVGTYDVRVQLTGPRMLFAVAFPVYNFTGIFRDQGAGSYNSNAASVNSDSGELILGVVNDIFRSGQEFLPSVVGMTELYRHQSASSGEFAFTAASIAGASPNVVLGYTAALPIGFAVGYHGVSIGPSTPPIPRVVTQHRWAKVPIRNPVSHYGGFVQPRAKDTGVFMRSISDRSGRHEVSSFQFKVKDMDRYLRKRAAGATSQYFDNSTVIVRTQTDDDRRAGKVARTLGIGLIREAAPETPMLYRFRADEYLSKYMGSDRSRSQVPKRQHSPVYIPGLPTAMRGKPEKICYGDLTSGASATAAPKLNLQWNDGGFFNPDVEGWGVSAWHLGWGTLVSSAAVPTGVSVSVSSGGMINPGDAPLNLYNIAVTAVDGSGKESDPIHFNWHEPNYPYFALITGGGQKINVSWNPSAGAVGYRVYVGYANKDEAFMRIQTLATSVAIDRVVRFGDTPSTANIPANAEVITFSESWIYAVSALMPDGETPLSALAYGKSQGYKRPLKIQWNLIPGALGYRVYRREVQVKGLKLGKEEPAEKDSIWDRRWDVGPLISSFSDDLDDTGVIMVQGTSIINGNTKVRFTGTETSVFDGSQWLRFEVAAHAIYGITGVFVDEEQVDPVHFGQTVLVPGWPGYDIYFPNTGARCQYRDLTGSNGITRRFTFIYARGPVADAVAKGEKVGSVNLIGIESKGDSTGTPLLNIVDQYKHFMKNFVYNDYQTGDWFQVAPVWPDVTPTLLVMDDATFDAARTMTLTRMGNSQGYVGGTVIGEEDFETVEELIQDFNMSLDANSYVNERQQFCIDIQDNTITTYTSEPLYTQVNGDINKGTFKCEPSNEEWENYIPYSYRYNWQRNTYMESTYLDNQTSISKYQETKPGNEINLRFIHDPGVAANNIQNRLDRNAFKPYNVSWDTTARGINSDITSFIGFQTAEMIGVDPDYIHLIRLERQEFDSNTYVTSLTGRLRSLVILAVVP